MNLQKKFYGGQSEKEIIEFTGVNEIYKIYKNYIRINQQNQRQPYSKTFFIIQAIAGLTSTKL
jgi:DNA/RNA endonuclease YhcR with UshA esterase domain